MVSVDERGLKRVNYGELPYLMLQAIRDLKTQNDDLKEVNHEFREQLKAEDERLRRLEAALSDRF